MTCSEVVERLSEYWSNELDEATRSELVDHLKACPICQQEWVAFQSAMSVLLSVQTPEPPPELLTRIKSAIQAKQRPKPVLVWRWQWVATATAAAALLIAIFSYPLFRGKEERAVPVIAEMTTPSLPAPTLSQPASPAHAKPSTPHLSLSIPSPKERIARPHPPVSAIRREEVRQSLLAEAEQKRHPIPPEGLPLLSIPSGERPTAQEAKGITPEIDIVPYKEQTNPQVAELPTTPRRVPFRAELELSEQVKVPKVSPPEQPVPSMPQSPVGPTVAGAPSEFQRSNPPESQPPIVARHYGLGQSGGGQAQVSAFPFNLRWIKVEPVVVGKVRLLELALSSYIPQVVTVSVQPGEKVEILNPQRLTEAGKFVVWRDKLQSGKETPVPLLLKANEIGTRRLLLTVETADGRIFSWWCVFAAMEREELPKIRKPVSLQISQWIVLDLLSHLAWEGKVAFLLPEPIGSQIVNLPQGTMAISEVLGLLERQLGGKWQRFGNTFNWISPIPIAPVFKQ